MTDLKELFSPMERELIFNNRVLTPNIRQLRYRIRQKIKYALSQIVTAVVHPEIRDYKLVIAYLKGLKTILKEYDMEEYVDTIDKIIKEIIIKNQKI